MIKLHVNIHEERGTKLYRKLQSFLTPDTFFIPRRAVTRLALTTPLGQSHLQAGKFWFPRSLFNPWTRWVVSNLSIILLSPRVTGSKTELLILKAAPRKCRHPCSLMTEGAAYLACVFLRWEEKSHHTFLQDSSSPLWHSSAWGPTDNEKWRTLMMFSEQKGTVISAL